MDSRAGHDPGDKGGGKTSQRTGLHPRLPKPTSPDTKQSLSIIGNRNQYQLDTKGKQDMTGTNTTIQHEIKGFEKAMQFFNTPARATMSPEMVLSIADGVRKRARPSQFGQGFYDAAVIIARSRKAIFESVK